MYRNSSICIRNLSYNDFMQVSNWQSLTDEPWSPLDNWLLHQLVYYLFLKEWNIYLYIYL